MTNETTDLLDELIAECIRAEEAGQPVDRAKLLAEHPQFAGDLRDFFADRDRIKSLARPLSPGAPRRQFVPPKIRYFGDYELLEEVARGGMGVVYKARQTSLNRIVAVKLILSGHLADQQDVQRFQSEAEAVANLRHPCIVAVHEVGLHEGQHYFSMDYIEGRNLSEIIREKPLPARQAATYVRKVAEAIHDAHQQGTLHRDLKPSNVLIDAADGVHITDFGLAMKVEGDSGLTRTGQVLGTPSYMPPEQAQGNRALVGPASDVYSLGVVLYELLTGRPPFRTESAVETVRQVIECEPVSPRVLSPHVPRDLETICLMCLEKEPHRRYVTAARLAEDLRRFENGEPILARPINRPARLWRWCRRKPLVAGLTAGLLLALLVGTVVSGYFAIEMRMHARHYRDEFLRAEGLLAEKDGFIQQEGRLLTEKTELAKHLETALADQRTATQRATEQTKLAEGLLEQKTRLSDDLAGALAKQEVETDRADRQRDRAERYLKKAHQAVDLITQASEEQLRGMPGLEPVRRELLAATLGYFEEFLDEQNPDPELQEELARTFIRVGRIRSLLGAQAEAMADYNRALAIFRRLAAQRSEDFEFQFSMIKTQVDVGYKQSELRRPVDAIATYEAAIAQLLPLIDQHPDHRTLKLLLARAYHNLGVAHAQLHQFPDAARYYDLALSIRKPYGGLEQLYNDIGYLQLTMGNLDKALDANQNALEIRSRLLRRNPKNPNFRHDVAGSRNHIGDVHRQARRHDAAITEYEAAVALQEELVHDYANIARYRAALANSYSNLASVFYQIRRLDDALSVSNKALEQCRHLIQNAPDDAANHEALAGAIHEIARNHEARGELETALQYRKEQEATWLWLVERRPSQPYYDRRVTQALTAQASLLNQLGRTEEAKAATQRAENRHEPAAHVPVVAARPEVMLATGNSNGPPETQAIDVILSEPGEKVVYKVAFSPNGQFLAAGGGARGEKQAAILSVWNVDQQKLVFTTQIATEGKAPLGNRVLDLSFSHDNLFLATGDEMRSTRVWEARSGRERIKFVSEELKSRGSVSHHGRANAVAFSPNRRFVASGSQGGRIRLWDTSTSSEVRVFNARNTNSLAFSADGTRLYSCGGTLDAWDVETGKQLYSQKLPVSAWRLALSGDGERVALGLNVHSANTQHSVDIRDAADGTQLRTIGEGKLGIFDVAFSPDDRRLATAGYDKTVRVFDVETGDQLWSYAHQWPVFSVDFHPDGTKLAAGWGTWRDPSPGGATLHHATDGTLLVQYSPRQVSLPGDLARQLARLKAPRVESRQHAAVVLAQWGPAAAAAIPALIDALDDDDEVVRANASVALSQIGRTAVPALIAVLKKRTLKGRPVFAAERAAIALGRIGSHAREAVPTLIELLGTSSSELIRAATGALEQIELEPDQAKQAALRLGDIMAESWWWQANCLPEAARAGLRRIGPQAIPKLLPLLDDSSDAVRHRAARTLGDIGPGAEAAVPALSRLLQDDSRGIREIAAIALAQIGPLGVERLVFVLRSDDAETRRRAASALGHATGQAKLVVGPLTATVKDRDIRVRTAAAESLAAFGKDATAATSALAETLEDDERIVHFAADFALRRINPQRAIELLGPPYNPVQAALEDIATLKVGKHDWPQWGGARFRVNTPEGKNIPHEWNVGLDPNTFEKVQQQNIKWQAKLGSQTYGNPVVANGKVFVGTNNAAGHLKRFPPTVDLGCLLCVDEQTGKFVWQLSVPKLPTGRVHDWPLQGLCAAPLVDGDRLWVTTNGCEIVCLDVNGFRDGENDGPFKDEDNENRDEADVVWKLDMIGELGVSPHNMSTCSPITADGRLFVCTSNGQDEFHTRIPAPEAPSFMALDRQTGKVLWTDNSPGQNILHGQWASPSYGVFEGQPQVIFPGGDGWVYSFDPEGDGQGNSKLLWKFDGNPKESKWVLGGRGTRNSIIAFPAIYDGLVYITMGQDPEHGEGQGHLWCIAPTERGDVSAELAVDAAGKRLPHRRLQAVDRTRGERAISNPNSAVVWHYGALTEEEYNEMDFEEAFHRSLGIPAIKDDLLYVADYSGLFHCLNAKTGKAYWTYDMFAAAWGSALVVDGKVYIGDEDGDVAIFRHGRKREMLGEINFGNSVYSTPIVANNVLFISNKSTLFAIAHDDGAK